MTITPKALWGETVVPTSAAALYTSPANTTTVISRGAFTNVGAAAQLTLWVVRALGSRADGNIIVGASAAGQAISAGPSEPYVPAALAGLTLAPGDALHAKSDTASAINSVGSGWVQ